MRKMTISTTQINDIPVQRPETRLKEEVWMIVTHPFELRGRLLRKLTMNCLYCHALSISSDSTQFTWFTQILPSRDVRVKSRERLK